MMFDTLDELEVFDEREAEDGRECVVSDESDVRGVDDDDDADRNGAGLGAPD